LLALELLDTVDPTEYLRRLGYEPFEWQVFALDAIKKGWTRVHINGARQSGKSTVTAGVPAYVSKTERALSLIYAPSDDQSKDDIERVKDFIRRDDSYPHLVLDSTEHIKLPNGSYVRAHTSTAKTKRGKSMPRVIVFDEAAWIEDVLYKTVRPMLTENPRCVVIALSTPNGRDGWFYRASQSRRWLRVVVKAPWDLNEYGELIPAEGEAQFRRRMAANGIHGFYSPRHRDKEFMLEELEEHGERWFRQEYLCEYVEPEDLVFDYDQVDRIFDHPLKAEDKEGVLVSPHVESL
jgi:phage terminase large subunit GpA-like protein